MLQNIRWKRRRVGGIESDVVNALVHLFKDLLSAHEFTSENSINLDDL